MHANQSSLPPQTEEVHLQDYLQVLFCRRWTVILVFLLTFSAVTLYTFLVRPTFEAKATLHVRESKVKGAICLEISA